MCHDYDGFNSLILKNATITNSAYENFGLIYSSFQVEILNTNISHNIFKNQIGISDFLICENHLYTNNLKADNNYG